MQVLHVTPMRNVERIRREGLFPRLGRNSKAAGEPTPAVFCFPDRPTMENALSNWLGEQFSDEDVAILTLNIHGLLTETEENGYELRVFECISQHRIMSVEDEYGKVIYERPCEALAA